MPPSKPAHDVPSSPAPVSASTRHPSRRGEARRFLLIAAAVGAAFLLLYWGRRGVSSSFVDPDKYRETKVVGPKIPYPTPTPIPPDRKTEHVALYTIENADPQTGSVVHFDKLTKVWEWWKKADLLRDDVPLNADLLAHAANPAASIRSERTVYEGNLKFFRNAGGQSGHYYDYNAPQLPHRWENYSLEQMAGDNAGLRYSRAVSGGTKTANGQTIHTWFVTRTNAGDANGANGPRYVCQINEKTNLPVQLDVTYKRGGKWVTILRYVFEWNRSIPAGIYDRECLTDVPPKLTFPLTQAQESSAN